MSSNIREDTFDDLLAVAFERYMEDELSKLPSEEELAKMYPIPVKQMREMQRYARRLRYRNSKPMVYLKRVAVACLIIISLTVAGLAVTPAGREAIKETVVTWYEKYVQFDFANSNSDIIAEITDIHQLNISYIPDGFVLASSTDTDAWIEYVYMSDNGDYILIGIYSTETVSVATDIELADFTPAKINNNDAYILYNDIDRLTCIITGNNVYTISITAVANNTEIIKVAENIK